MTATTLTLADFILARVAEDEAAARAAFTDPSSGETRTYYSTSGPMRDSWGVYTFNVPPARVLAECEAKRAIVEVFRPGRIVLHDSTGVRAQTGEMDDPRGVDILRALASVYADHPDFDPGWSATAEFAVGE